MAPSGISLNKPAAITILVLVAGGVIMYRWGWSSPHSSAAETDISNAGSKKGNADIKPPDDSKMSKEIDVNKLPDFPLSPDINATAIKMITIDVKVKDKTLKINSRQTGPAESPTLTVLLLHGQAFTSQDWIRTLRLLASWGYKAVAIDLPDFGKSKAESLGDASEEEFMTALVGTLGSAPVIVSPSMSGRFSLPYLFSDRSDSEQRAAAFIPVAPVMTDKFKANYPKSQVPTLIVYGTEDKNLGTKSRADLQALPKAQIAPIPGAGHACYMDKPDLFRNVLHYFLTSLTK
ncbi:putative protein-lysine deacylase ABHD14B isoform X2 [Littorina saxatilis]|uniref:AB hydrolase-1 domain-containing protein n=1 Tax=Littorina saxatilis TaxID=31220 RepID=A0AAN9G4H7_9CAEN